MFITKDTKQRINHYAPVTINDVQYSSYPMELLDEIPGPTPPTPPEGFTVDEAFFYNELTDAPYAEWTLKSPEQLNDIRRNKVIMQIAQLEARQGRAVREAALGDPTCLLKIETKIVALRATL